MWADGFGKLGIRALQIILVVGSRGGIIFAIQQLTLVTIPLVIALILACAFNPVDELDAAPRGALRAGHVMTLLTIVILLAAIGWLIVWAVRGQWDELYAQARGRASRR